MASNGSAFWVAEPGRGEIRAESLPEPGPDQVRVRTLHSAISRGTERLVFAGRVPPDQYDAMRAPFQAGDLPGPVKYGYLSVGTVEAGEPSLLGRTVFCLHPHQTSYVVPAGAVTPVPVGVPARRAVLAGTVETALNALWQARPMLGDRACVVGAGLVGCCLARLLAGIPGAEVTLVDVDPSRAEVAAALGVGFATPERAPRDQDVVLHASATGAGLATALGLLPDDGAVVELSWYGEGQVGLALGGDFHSRRLGITASQVGALPRTARPRWTPGGRLALALALLRDPAFDALLTGSSRFADLPTAMEELAAGSLDGICHTITYEDA
ncbi:zinc-binding alcohol dehydrogenase [Nocardioides sp. YIM 152588]|uniref:zinc-dependent alcohol dehydrogenase n=1 Tax=Nocardioides sp. YIM 152588 TaxID=3158259 RepID=UPI0032E4AC3E